MTTTHGYQERRSPDQILRISGRQNRRARRRNAASSTAVIDDLTTDFGEIYGR